MKRFFRDLSTIFLLGLTVAALCSTGCELFRDYGEVALNGETRSDAGSDDARTGDTGIDDFVAVCPGVADDADVFYVSPDGTADGDGTRERPWDVDTASASIRDGQTLLFMPGEYDERFLLAESGRPGRPIVLRSEVRHEAIIRAPSGNSYGFGFDNHSYVRLEGFKFLDTQSRWITAVDSHHIVFSDLWFDGHTGVGVPFSIENCADISLLDSFSRRTFKHIVLRFENIDYLEIAGNAFGLAHSRSLSVEGSQNVVIRGNVFHNAVGPPFFVFKNENVLFENNIVTNAIEGPGTDRSYARISGRGLILRRNRVFRNWGVPMGLTTDGGTEDLVDVRAYHNVFDDTRDVSYLDGEGLAVFGEGTFSNLKLMNNIFSRNGADGNRQIRGHDFNDEVLFESNVLWDGAGVEPLLYVDFTDYTLSEARTNTPGAFSGNSVEAPGYLDADSFDHRLKSTSPLQDAAAPLAVATSSGSGSNLPVSDALPFYDGFGIEGEQGDIVAIGSPKNRARIVSVNDGALELDRDVPFEDGDAVHLPWDGDAPEIGAWESNLVGGPPFIVTSAFVATAGEEVSLRVELPEDVRPVRMEWRLGDGTHACTREVKHVFPSGGDYPIRLRIVDSEGRVHRAVSYVLVESGTVDVDSVDYNIGWIDEFLCDGDAHSYTGNEPGRDRVDVESDGDGYVCVE